MKKRSAKQIPPKKKSKPVAVDSLKHKDRRINIPTEELRDFVKADEESPKTLLYPRDSSLDPQLVWKGKDEQDSTALEVPVVPVYIQEKIHPQALIENLRETAKKGEEEPELSLFADFNGIKDFEKVVDFYSHDAGSQPKWSNRMILGDSLLVMASLAEKEGLKGQVQMIYMDPPYGIKFGSNWQVSTRKRDVKDGKVEDATRQPEQIKAFRDTWELGIHSYLAYMRDRLVVARQLLTETGSVFVQIGDENVHLVRSVLDEIFGSENFCAEIVFKKTAGANSPMARVNVLAGVSDFILWYGKDRERLKYRQIYLEKRPRELEGYNKVESPDCAESRPLSLVEQADPALIPDEWHVVQTENATSSGWSETLSAPVTFNGKSFSPPSGAHWKTTPKGMIRLGQAGRLTGGGQTLNYKRRLKDFPVFPLTHLWTDISLGYAADSKVYVVQTSTQVIERCVLMTTDPGDFVLDPTCGSGTTAFVAEQTGRRWVTIDTSRVALALARTRLMAAKYPYHLLSDSSDGAKKEAEITGNLDALTSSSSNRFGEDVKKGFVNRRVPHITLKSIANNEDIDVIHARFNERLEPLRASLNKILKQKWEEWQVPRDADERWPENAKMAQGEWWGLRRERQKEIDASVARRADIELLYDQPYEDPKRIRVSGPFTVESLSPHRVLSPEEERPASEQEASIGPDGAGRFESMILDNLRKAGVQNTVRNERLDFDRLEPYPGAWIQAMGEYVDKSGVTKRVAVSIGPEHGTVGPVHVKEAAKEAMKGTGFDVLVVLGFAFDAHAGETAKEFSPEIPRNKKGFVAETETAFGRLPVLLTRMNPDLSMGVELLKKTGTGNLFMVFGEPDLEVRKQADGKYVATIRGVDVYDPTTGVIRSSSTDDIACWFIDTDYNGESFFVRHAYFTGAEEPYDKLKRALRAEIDEAAWATLYSTVSRPFDPPKSGKIAIKVINHYGDEVLTVRQVTN
jgi:adenine-specific DNA-methyltransferase